MKSLGVPVSQKSRAQAVGGVKDTIKDPGVPISLGYFQLGLHSQVGNKTVSCGHMVFKGRSKTILSVAFLQKAPLQMSPGIPLVGNGSHASKPVLGIRIESVDHLGSGV